MATEIAWKQKNSALLPTHCIRNLRFDQRYNNWYAQLYEIASGDVIAEADIFYILTFAAEKDYAIVETMEMY